MLLITEIFEKYFLDYTAIIKKNVLKFYDFWLKLRKEDIDAKTRFYCVQDLFKQDF